MSFPYKKIVTVSPARLGDTIMCTPAIRFLKLYRPEVELDVVCLSDLAAQVLRHNPDIDRLYLTPEDPELRRRAGHYDVGLNLHTSKPAVACYRELGVEVLGPHPVDPAQHAARQALALVEQVVGQPAPREGFPYALYPRQEHYSRIGALLESQGASPDQDILVGCHLGCHGIAKRGRLFWKSLVHEKVWPLERFVELERMARDLDPRVRFVLTGSRNERRLGKAFRARGARAVDLIGRTSVLDLAALIRTLDVFITPDTGSLHIACAMGVSLIALFGPTPVSRTGPYPKRPNQKVIRKAAMAQIGVEEVLEALVESGALRPRKAGHLRDPADPPGSRKVSR
ncbi:MAG: glycosyltransferase family 9 protein [Deltaproteobacteria bacterium]|nr:glycosyltransferase family 9 protein [Deltaproteobacteria bacterium]MBW1923544.1 glycosyltransferase family 9 protein [Deltaproteobacteria bacterium]MBW1951306.1 glycosyltransferase family 9 protein [Deltaproteobacteria bacterium]MBW2008548.1 glycosyltransferase family 9 protein [Deltaproteobacteria bacterium]MBW2349416.1 glycosyltransferase family 9 protein [Deltaproteobacteria bacterium]